MDWWFLSDDLTYLFLIGCDDMHIECILFYGNIFFLSDFCLQRIPGKSLRISFGNTNCHKAISTKLLVSSPKMLRPLMSDLLLPNIPILSLVTIRRCHRNGQCSITSNWAHDNYRLLPHTLGASRYTPAAAAGIASSYADPLTGECLVILYRGNPIDILQRDIYISTV